MNYFVAYKHIDELRCGAIDIEWPEVKNSHDLYNLKCRISKNIINEEIEIIVLRKKGKCCRNENDKNREICNSI
jgi:hypothetical protein